MTPAIFVVRAAVLDPAQRDAFDRWYRDVHLPDAMRSFPAAQGVARVESQRSRNAPMYQFDDVVAVERAVGDEEMKRLIADFNRDWPDVTRTREGFALAQIVGG